MSTNKNRRVKGVVYYRNDDGSFSGDSDKIYYDEEVGGEEELTELEEKLLERFTATVLAPMFYRDMRKKEQERL